MQLNYGDAFSFLVLLLRLQVPSPHQSHLSQTGALQIIKYETQQQPYVKNNVISIKRQSKRNAHYYRYFRMLRISVIIENVKAFTMFYDFAS